VKRCGAARTSGAARRHLLALRAMATRSTRALRAAAPGKRAPAAPARPAPSATGLAPGPDGAPRCFWAVSAPDYVDYHDREWGFPVVDDRRLFEKLCLEGFQAGLSWLTILRKREAFRRAFAGFDPAAVARFGARDVTRLLGDAGIVRHRGKIESTINNAARALELIAERGSLAAYVWGFVPPAAERPAVVTRDALRAMTQTPTSVALSRDLKRRGWSFVGPTTVYAFMQAMGLVDDHLEGCVIRPAAEADRRARVPASPGGGAAPVGSPAAGAPQARTPKRRAP
jgi:DNA-3-methyladenine glycosylase I